MIGAALFGGFCAGIAVILTVLVIADKRAVRRTQWPVEPEANASLPENKELARLRRQLAEIERYSGGEIGGQ